MTPQEHLEAAWRRWLMLLPEMPLTTKERRKHQRRLATAEQAIHVTCEERMREIHGGTP